MASESQRECQRKSYRKVKIVVIVREGGRKVREKDEKGREKVSKNLGEKSDKNLDIKSDKKSEKELVLSFQICILTQSNIFSP